MPKLQLRRPPQRPTHPLVWCLAILCAILALAVIITGIVVFVGYMIIHPKVPKLGVSSANLDSIYFDQASELTVRVIIAIKAENDNAKASASFYETSFDLYFQGVKIAILIADPFDVSQNNSHVLNYVVESKPVPLSPDESDVVQMSINQNKITFYLKGHTRTRWRIGPLGSVKFWLRLDCQLVLPVDKTPIHPKCITRSK